jgi:hypothetical protein
VSVTRTRSRLANEVKRAKRDQDDQSEERVADARRELAVAKLEAYIAAVVAAAPPLSEDQKQRLALLLRATP